MRGVHERPARRGRVHVRRRGAKGTGERGERGRERSDMHMHNCHLSATRHYNLPAALSVSPCLPVSLRLSPLGNSTSVSARSNVHLPPSSSSSTAVGGFSSRLASPPCGCPRPPPDCRKPGRVPHVSSETFLLVEGPNRRLRPSSKNVSELSHGETFTLISHFNSTPLCRVTPPP